MRREGLEPSRTDVPRILSPVRLPISPSTLDINHYTNFLSKSQYLNRKITSVEFEWTNLTEVSCYNFMPLYRDLRYPNLEVDRVLPHCDERICFHHELRYSNLEGDHVLLH